MLPLEHTCVFFYKSRGDYVIFNYIFSKNPVILRVKNAFETELPRTSLVVMLVVPLIPSFFSHQNK